MPVRTLIPYEVRDTFSFIFKKILYGLKTIEKYHGNFSILSFHKGIPYSYVDVEFFAKYHDEEILFIMPFRVDDGMQRRQSELYVKKNLKTLEHYLSLPFNRLPLCIPLPKSTPSRRLVGKVIQARLKVGE